MVVLPGIAHSQAVVIGIEHSMSVAKMVLLTPYESIKDLDNDSCMQSVE